MATISTQQKPYTLGSLAKDLGGLKMAALDIANQAYRIVHEIEDVEEKALPSAARAG